MKFKTDKFTTVITDNGKKIKFVKGEYSTEDKEEIEYLKKIGIKPEVTKEVK